MKKKISEAQLRATAKYDRKAYKQLRARFRRAERLDELVKLAAGRRGVSDAAYIVGAVRDRLQADGVTVSDLPPAAEDGIREE